MVDHDPETRLHPRNTAFVLLMITLWCAGAVRAEKDSERLISTREAILRWIDCGNPEEVAQTVFGEAAEIEAFELQRFDYYEQPLGDGSLAHVFAPPGGNGSWAARPSHHFVRRDGGRLELFFESTYFSEYLVELPRFNGRYQIQVTWRADFVGGIDDEDIELAHGLRRWFWNGEEYVEAYTRIEVEESVAPAKLGVTVTWKHHDAWQAARRSWTYTVDYYDTLLRLCLDHEVPCDEVARQSGLADPDKLQVGQVLVWDSAQ